VDPSYNIIRPVIPHMPNDILVYDLDEALKGIGERKFHQIIVSAVPDRERINIFFVDRDPYHLDVDVFGISEYGSEHTFITGISNFETLKLKVEEKLKEFEDEHGPRGPHINPMTMFVFICSANSVRYQGW
jgi:hypothetical protein